MMECVHWIVDKYLLERDEDRTEGPTISDAVRAAGHVVHEVRYQPGQSRFEPKIAVPSREIVPVVFWGTLEGLRCVRRMPQSSFWSTIAFCNEANLSYAGFAPHIGDLLLNDGFAILNVGEIRRRCAVNVRAFLDPFGGSAFIRPNKVTKVFGARVITPGNASFEMASLAAEHVGDDELVVLSPTRHIADEFRFVIADRRVVASSQYLASGEVLVREGAREHATGVAAEVARRAWQPDRVYVCDVGISLAGPKVIELNSFSCAGLYACDTRAVVDAVSAAALAEFSEEFVERGDYDNAPTDPHHGGKIWRSS